MDFRNLSRLEDSIRNAAESCTDVESDYKGTGTTTVRFSSVSVGLHEQRSAGLLVFFLELKDINEAGYHVLGH
jgi:hypothetical protein